MRAGHQIIRESSDFAAAVSRLIEAPPLAVVACLSGRPGTPRGATSCMHHTVASARRAQPSLVLLPSTTDLPTDPRARPAAATAQVAGLATAPWPGRRGHCGCALWPPHPPCSRSVPPGMLRSLADSSSSCAARGARRGEARCGGDAEVAVSTEQRQSGGFHIIASQCATSAKQI
ncbi:hypothetical protein BS78_01G245100 [Paspalum vaginatum]|nr:hypothetical protein BS78_01G245100 [Paspalum vaginatum]